MNVYNYWEEKPFVTVGNPKVKWIALERCQVSLLRQESYGGQAGCDLAAAAIGDADAGNMGRSSSRCETR